MTEISFAPRGSKAEIEEGERLSPKFDADGLLTAVTVDADDGTVLMVAHMNAQALALTIETGVAHYFSRSRGRLWKKGEESGHLQQLVELRVDCDQDAVVLRVRMPPLGPGVPGAACHTGHRSCFFRSVPLGAAPTPELTLAVNDDGPLFDPAKVYGLTKKTDTPRF
ncbi:phosphoribosyl-AMP cyclohydrolase [Ancylobacter polymorphus]|jgi:phosphoribosyl-AMP cyclohydrolase|uniref:Phosphoribosyl-AMP cyclohydrolase n=1 Tax=Ancylobacter polymorphus TaxID=223390 RepID=A0A9E6ZTL5_9HYPH|nr:phosphoribosyl-AMP cyclohydrolase [Ancylobacter polymorphus]MDQ0301727.1 phosphoribosyl-AMP cyclohydrolase [Ancylobacter polymorphus]MPT22845.1 phosphoribosyl-AMP cyclohydrolase [Starkeya sp.]UOK69927.1 phosphoribosyl-AMP cyclohydrolase [Ancylobacter polymorphus]